MIVLREVFFSIIQPEQVKIIIQVVQVKLNSCIAYATSADGKYFGANPP